MQCYPGSIGVAADETAAEVAMGLPGPRSCDPIPLLPAASDEDPAIVIGTRAGWQEGLIRK